MAELRDEPTKTRNKLLRSSNGPVAGVEWDDLCDSKTECTYH